MINKKKPTLLNQALKSGKEVNNNLNRNKPAATNVR